AWGIPRNTAAGKNSQVRIRPSPTSIKGDESRNNVVIDPWHKPFDDVVTKFRNDNNVPGSQLGIAHEGKLLWAHGDGKAVRDGADVTDKSLFRIASVTKPITAAAIIRLSENGREGLLDEKVFAILNDY